MGSAFLAVKEAVAAEVEAAVVGAVVVEVAEGVAAAAAEVVDRMVHSRQLGLH